MDSELEAEQAYVDQAYSWLEWMRARALDLVAGTDPKELDLVHALRRRAASLTDGGRPLCFGRIDGDDGVTFHVGRRHVEDRAGDPVVVEWRAPVAEAFYRASPGSPQGLRRRRQFVVDGRRIQSMADDAFGPVTGDSGAGRTACTGEGPAAARVRGGDALLAELERSRGAEMLDIVATIQAEQDEVIRSPLAGVLVCQGGPGSGKTAVGLHRAAFLLYGDDALARQGVLVLGPNRVFLRYIGQVLPSLGEDAVIQTTVRDLAAGVRVVAEDHPGAERIKGDARMATVLRRALAQGRRPVEADLSVPVGLRTLVVPAAEVNEIARSVEGRRLSYESGRGVLRDALVARCLESHPGAQSAEHGRVASAVRSSPALGAALDRLWPATNASALVRALLTRKEVLAAAADGVLSAAEQAAVRHRRTPTQSLDAPGTGRPVPAWELRDHSRRRSKPKRLEPWTAADVALLDEASWLVSGESRTYGHIVVDEAQDLSPMQVRMIGRRAPGGSVTILGDLAQASGPWAPHTWEEVVSELPRPDGWRLAELRLGYRSPGDVIDLASRLLPIVAPHVTPTEAVRSRRGGVRMIPAADTAGATAAEAEALAARYGSVAVIVAGAALPGAEAALKGRGLDVGTAGIDHPVSLVEASQAKGLEFDAVVVSDPAAIVGSAPDEVRGLRLLYVALTRPTQALSVVHGDDLPAPLAGAFAPVAMGPMET